MLQRTHYSQYSSFNFLSRATLGAAFGEALAYHLVKELKLIKVNFAIDGSAPSESAVPKPATSFKPEQQAPKPPAQFAPSNQAPPPQQAPRTQAPPNQAPPNQAPRTQAPPSQAPPNQAQPPKHGLNKSHYSGVAATGAVIDDLGRLNISSDIPEPQAKPATQPKHKAPLERNIAGSIYMTERHKSMKGPKPIHPKYSYDYAVEQYPRGTYRDANGESTHGKVNLKLLSNDNAELWKKQSGDPCFCYNYFLKGQCHRAGNCFLRHVPPTKLELKSLEWWNPVLVATMLKVHQQRKPEHRAVSTKLFPGMSSDYL